MVCERPREEAEVMDLQEILRGLMAEQAPGGGSFMALLFPIFLMFIVIYFMMIRPQQKELKRHQDLVTNLKKGDEIVTKGGIIGKVAAVSDHTVSIEVSRDVKLRVLKGQVAGLYNEAQAAAAGAGAQQASERK
jgi:preprotein translocase subunit YajC